MFDLTNDGVGDQQLRPIGGPWSLFRRMRNLPGGHVLRTLICIIGFMNLFAFFSATASRENDYGKGFSNSRDSEVDVDSVNARALNKFSTYSLNDRVSFAIKRNYKTTEIFAYQINALNNGASLGR